MFLDTTLHKKSVFLAIIHADDNYYCIKKFKGSAHFQYFLHCLLIKTLNI